MQKELLIYVNTDDIDHNTFNKAIENISINE